MKKHYYIYETTNNINGKKYRGAHGSYKLDNDYLGSGKLIYYAIQKYGVDNFTKQILLTCEKDEVYKFEEKYVDAAWVDRKDTYNLKVGGDGGWDYVNEYLKQHPEKRNKLPPAAKGNTYFKNWIETLEYLNTRKL